MASETWRVVLASGEVREVDSERTGADLWCALVDGYHGWGRSQPSAVAAVTGMHGWPVTEILAPGVLSRAELEARLAAVTAQRDRAVESVARLRRDVEHEMVRRDIAEAERDEAQVQRDEAREALATARREGAEDMRAAAVRLLDACGSPRVKLTIDDAVYAVNFAAAGLTVDERRKVTS